MARPKHRTKSGAKPEAAGNREAAWARRLEALRRVGMTKAPTTAAPAAASAADWDARVQARRTRGVTRD